jgi:hypothetical protein
MRVHTLMSVLADYSYLVECSEMTVYFGADTASSLIQFSCRGSGATLSDIR